MILEPRDIKDGFICEIDGLFLWEDLGKETALELAKLLSEFGVVVLRHQALSESDLVRVAGMIGELEPSVRYDWASKYFRDVGYISNMRDPAGTPIGGLGTNEVVWHMDQSYLANPVTGAMLYCVETPPNAGKTSWANLILAYEGLPDKTKKRIENHIGIFSYERRSQTYEAGSRPSKDIRQITPPVEHRLVNQHPRTGQKALYLDPATMDGIVGLSHEESAELIAELNVHATRDEFVYTHTWSVGDVVIWDNGFTLHKRENFDASESRLLKRLQFRLSEEISICPS